MRKCLLHSHKQMNQGRASVVNANQIAPLPCHFSSPRSLCRYHHHYRCRLGLANPSVTGSLPPGGSGRGPVGGGGLIGSAPFWNGCPNLALWSPLVLLVLGGNIGLDDGSIADIGSGMLSLLTLLMSILLAKPSLFVRETGPLGASCVSRERCWRDRGGDGERSAIPVGTCSAGTDCGRRGW
jgi:hypothetical protein